MLVAVVEFAADLSERQCVQVLAHVMLMPDDDLVSCFGCEFAVMVLPSKRLFLLPHA